MIENVSYVVADAAVSASIDVISASADAGAAADTMVEDGAEGNTDSSCFPSCLYMYDTEFLTRSKGQLP